MRTTVKVDPIEIDKVLFDFVGREALPGTGVDEQSFWKGFASLVSRLAPRNAALLAERDRLQASIDAWHRDRPGAQFDAPSYKTFLTDIGYLVPEGSAFTVNTAAVDAEIAHIAGPQLVVPVNNARYALNAANARWGSLYDALYGTDAISRDGPLAPGKGFNAARGAAVVARAAQFLDEAFPLAGGSHAAVTGYHVIKDAGGQRRFVADTASGRAELKEPAQFVGYGGTENAGELVLRHNSLHAILVIDPQSPIGRTHAAGLSDIVIESALSTIEDCEDSVAAVDAEDKVAVYRNWLGLMDGTLKETFEKAGK